MILYVDHHFPYYHGLSWITQAPCGRPDARKATHAVPAEGGNEEANCLVYIDNSKNT